MTFDHILDMSLYRAASDFLYRLAHSTNTIIHEIGKKKPKNPLFKQLIYHKPILVYNCY